MLKDFNPFRTSILITSILEPSKDGEKIASLRTMKVMRSALVCIPIVDVAWCKSCLDKKKLIPPASHHCVTSLPTKNQCFMDMDNLDIGIDLDQKRDFSTAMYGVPSLVAARPSLLFDNVSVFICGSEWKKSPTKLKDVQLLLREAGGTVLTAASQATKMVNGELESEANDKIIFLCDQSSTDSKSGITAALAKSIRERYGKGCNQDGRMILIVNSNWLFDSISCAKQLDSTPFQPCSPLAISLWRLLAFK